MATEKVEFKGSGDTMLAGSLETPDHGEVRFYGIFAHCFTCSKDIAAASRISRRLAKFGIGVLRFDFSGLGQSAGRFEETNFSSNIMDLLAAHEYLKSRAAEARLLVGHSLGGAAVLYAARYLKEVRAVSVIGAPFEPAHVLAHFKSDMEQIKNEGQAVVRLGSRFMEIQKQFLDDILMQDKPESFLQDLHKALLIFHSPQDETVGIENAQKIYQHAKHPKSFISLDGAHHLLNNLQDAEYVASILSAWADRYVAQS